jgi:hypothetical protein
MPVDLELGVLVVEQHDLVMMFPLMFEGRVIVETAEVPKADDDVRMILLAFGLGSKPSSSLESLFSQLCFTGTTKSTDSMISQFSPLALLIEYVLG